MNKQVTIALLENSSQSSWLNQGLAIENDQIILHLPSQADNALRQIQQNARVIESLGASSVVLTGEQWTEAAQWAFAQGFSSVNKAANVEFTGNESLVSKLQAKQRVFAWSKNLIHQTPAQLYPEKLVSLAVEHLKELAPDAISYEVISGEALCAAGWHGIYQVGKGSEHAPAMLILDFNPTGDQSAVVDTVLVGKGITFDSGGYSLKSNEGMVSMKGDMGGAAAVSGALSFAIEQGLNKRVKLILCCAENMISGHAYKLGDIITYKNGTTVEILNTDAEGRLVLADGLMAAGEFSPNKIIDAATLTGAAVLATGGDYTAVFSLDQPLADKAKNVAAKVNDPVWQLPLERWHQDKCPSPFADTANSRAVKGGGAGGASNAAGFLSRFVPNDGKGWLHLDLAADYNKSATEFWSAGATGSGIALIAQMLLDD